MDAGAEFSGVTPVKNNLIMLAVDVIQAALLFIPTDDPRFYLNGLFVRVIDGNVAALASDGVTLFRHEINDYQGVDDSAIIIPQFVVKLSLTVAKKQKLDYIPLNIDERFLGEVGFRPIEAKYPNFDMAKLRSGVQDEEESTYDIELLARLQKASNILGDSAPILPALMRFSACGVMDLGNGNLGIVMNRKL